MKNHINNLRIAAVNNTLSFKQLLILTAIIIVVVAGSMYAYDPTSFNAYKPSF